MPTAAEDILVRSGAFFDFAGSWQGRHPALLSLADRSASVPGTTTSSPDLVAALELELGKTDVYRLFRNWLSEDPDRLYGMDRLAPISSLIFKILTAALSPLLPQSIGVGQQVSRR